MKTNSAKENIKILEIITLFSVGGATETVISIAAGLKNKSLSVDVITGPNIEIEGDMYKEARDLGLNVKTIPTLKREINLFYDVITFFKLYKIIKEGNYSLVHTHSAKAAMLGRWAARFAGVKKIVNTIHGWGFSSAQNKLLRNVLILLERITAKITSRFISVTPMDIEKGISNKIGNRNQYTVIRSGININTYSNPGITKDEIRHRLNINPQEIVVGTVTRFSIQKAPLDTILSFKEIIKKGYCNIRLLMIGDGPLLTEAKKLTKDLSMEDKVIFLGLRKDIPLLLKAMDIFVLSSLWEGLPRVIPQAMAAGVPVIATNIDGNSEIITDNYNGILVDTHCPEQIANAVIKLIDNPIYKQEIIARVKENLDEYDERKMVDDTYDLYNKLLNGNNVQN
jgi:glycosyltransferase involved in cell wall biosynthesis